MSKIQIYEQNTYPPINCLQLADWWANKTHPHFTCLSNNRKPELRVYMHLRTYKSIYHYLHLPTNEQHPLFTFDILIRQQKATTALLNIYPPMIFTFDILIGQISDMHAPVLSAS